jgi:hypothetical protein
VLWHDDDIVTVNAAGQPSFRPVSAVTVAEFKLLTSGAEVLFHGELVQLARVFKGAGQAPHLQVLELRHRCPPAALSFYPAKINAACGGREGLTAGALGTNGDSRSAGRAAARRTRSVARPRRWRRYWLSRPRTWASTSS